MMGVEFEELGVPAVDAAVVVVHYWGVIVSADVDV